MTQTTYTFVLTPDGNYDGLRSVYVTITDQGSVAVAQKKLSVDDRNGDGKIRTTMCSARCMRNTARTVWAAIKRRIANTAPYITRFWGKDTGNTGYWNGGRMCMGLDEEVSDGDHFVAMSYVKAYPETESYAKFGEFSYTASANAAVSISLETVTGYDASYNPVFGGCEGAELTGLSRHGRRDGRGIGKRSVYSRGNGKRILYRDVFAGRRVLSGCRE